MTSKVRPTRLPEQGRGWSQAHARDDGLTLGRNCGCSLPVQWTAAGLALVWQGKEKHLGGSVTAAEAIPPYLEERAILPTFGGTARHKKARIPCAQGAGRSGRCPGPRLHLLGLRTALISYVIVGSSDSFTALVTISHNSRTAT